MERNTKKGPQALRAVARNDRRVIERSVKEMFANGGQLVLPILSLVTEARAQLEDVLGEVNREIQTGEEDIFSGRKPAVLHSEGLVQKLEAGGNKVLATFTDGAPALVLIEKGKGRIYYLAAPLKAEDYMAILEPLAERLELTRPLLAIDSQGDPVTGAEVRSVERKNDYLIYASNLGPAALEFEIKGQSDIGQMIDLRSLSKITGNHVRLEPWQETIFRVEKAGGPRVSAR